MHLLVRAYHTYFGTLLTPVQVKFDPNCHVLPTYLTMAKTDHGWVPC